MGTHNRYKVNMAIAPPSGTRLESMHGIVSTLFNNQIYSGTVIVSALPFGHNIDILYDVVNPEKSVIYYGATQVLKLDKYLFTRIISDGKLRDLAIETNRIPGTKVKKILVEAVLSPYSALSTAFPISPKHLSLLPSNIPSKIISRNSYFKQQSLYEGSLDISGICYHNANLNDHLIELMSARDFSSYDWAKDSSVSLNAVNRLIAKSCMKTDCQVSSEIHEVFNSFFSSSQEVSLTIFRVIHYIFEDDTIEKTDDHYMSIPSSQPSIINRVEDYITSATPLDSKYINIQECQVIDALCDKISDSSSQYAGVRVDIVPDTQALSVPTTFAMRSTKAISYLLGMSYEEYMKENENLPWDVCEQSIVRLNSSATSLLGRDSISLTEAIGYSQNFSKLINNVPYDPEVSKKLWLCRYTSVVASRLHYDYAPVFWY